VRIFDHLCGIILKYPKNVYMKHFKTPLKIDSIRKVLDSLTQQAADTTCIVEIKNKKSLVIVADEGVAACLSNHSGFIPVFLTEPEIISLPVLHNVVSITGNADLFFLHKDYSGMLS